MCYVRTIVSFFCSSKKEGVKTKRNKKKQNESKNKE
jgi:hypothetical protein